MQIKKEERKNHGLCQCILGGRCDLCTGTDFNGKNEDASGQNYGHAALLGALGIYQPFIEFAGAGASVPLLGFGNTLFKGVKEAVDEYGFLGIFLGGLKASAAGISAALVFAYLASIIFQPKMKK